MTTIATIAENGVTAGAAFRRAVLSGYAGITATPTGSLSPNHKLALLRKSRSMDENQIVDGLPLRVWQSVFRPGMAEFSAATFVFTRESKDFVRIAFGNAGPRVDADGRREPVYTLAVTLTPETAVDLAGLLLKHFAEPTVERSSSSAEL